jgi:hypothetical protein
MESCKKPPSSSTSVNNSGQATINELDTFTVREIDFKYLSAKAKIKYKDADNDLAATAHIRIKKDSLIWLSIVPALGIEASRCLITIDSIFMLDRINNQFQSYSYSSLEQKINIHLNYHILQSMLLGSLPFPKTKKDILSKSQNKEYFILKQAIDDMEIENYIKSTSMKLEKFDIRESKTNKDLQVVYSNFLPLNNFFFPFEYHVSVTYPANNNLQHTSIAIEYNKVELPDKDLNFPFNIPNKFLKTKP